MLFIFGGLPATGKSELARYLARERSAVYLRIDTIERRWDSDSIVVDTAGQTPGESKQVLLQKLAQTV